MNDTNANKIVNRLSTYKDADMIRHTKPRQGQWDGMLVVLRSMSQEGIAMMLFTLSLYIAMNVATIIGATLLAEWIYHPLYYLVGAAGITRLSVRTALDLKQLAVMHDSRVVSSIQANAIPLLNLTGHRHPSRNQFEKLSSVRDPIDEVPYRTTVTQMAMIAREHNQAKNAAPNDNSRREIDLSTAKVVGRLLDTLKDATDRENGRFLTTPVEQVDLEGYAARVERIAEGKAPQAKSRRTGHADTDRLIDLAESTLTDKPDLVDGVGSSVATLVREHLPRLVEVHRRAVKGASEQDRAKADETFRRSLAKASSSVYEALAAYQRQRTEELEIEARFINERTGIRAGEIS